MFSYYVNYEIIEEQSENITITLKNLLKNNINNLYCFLANNESFNGERAVIIYDLNYDILIFLIVMFIRSCRELHTTDSSLVVNLGDLSSSLFYAGYLDYS